MPERNDLFVIASEAKQSRTTELARAAGIASLRSQ
jgi:hypothetical protein